VTALPVWAHELVVAPGAFGLAFLHARRALGTARAALELSVLAVYGFCLELAAIRSFSSHEYGTAWGLAPFGVPVAVAVVWAAVISSAMAIAPRLGWRSALGRGATAALVAIVLDLAMEPVAVRAGLWTWTPPGPWLGIPIGNFVGWAVVVGAYTTSVEIWPDQETDLRTSAMRRLALAAVSIAMLLAVGAVWTGWRAERLFAGPRGWMVWATVVSAGALAGLPALARSRAGRSATPSRRDDGIGLASRLAVPPATLPAGTFLLLAGAFTTDAALLQRADVGVVVLASLGVLAGLGRIASASP